MKSHWPKWIQTILNPQEAEIDIQEHLCNVLNNELQLLDMTINMQFKNVTTTLTPSTFKASAMQMKPAAHIMWALTLSWSRDEIESCAHTGFHIRNSQHVAMWSKFKLDFPEWYILYQPIINKGLCRTLPEVISTQEGESVEVIYYAFIPETALNVEDRDGLSSDY